MRISLFLNDEDYVQYNIFYQFNTPQGKRTVLIGKLLTPIVSLLFVLFFYLKDFPAYLILIEIFILSGISVWGWLTYEGKIKRRIHRQVEDLKKQGKLPYDAEATLDLSNEMIMDYTPSKTIRIEWSDVRAIWTNEIYIFVMIGAVQAIIIPRRCLNGMDYDVIQFLSSRSQRTPAVCKL